MSKFQDLIQAAKSKGQEKSDNYSRGSMVELATVMANDIDCEIPVYIKKGDTYEKRPMYPARSLRNDVLAPVLKSFGVDRAELARLNDVQISRAGGEALADFSMLLLKTYISKNGLNRKITLPMTSPTETVQSISMESAKEERRATTMIMRNGDDTYTTTPTGKIVTTKAHEKLKVANRVPIWLKSTEDAKPEEAAQ